MADNDYRAYRSRNITAHDDADVTARDAAYDPLEELARIIGQGGPSAEHGRGVRQDSNDSLADAAPAAPAPQWAADEAYAEPEAYAQQRYADPPEDDRYADPRADDRYIEPDQDDRYAQVRLADPPPHVVHLCLPLRQHVTGALLIVELMQYTDTEDQRSREDHNVRGGENCCAESADVHQP